MDSNDYGKIAGAGMFRTGVTPKFTFEASAEGTPGAVLAGAGGVAQIGNLGVLNFSAAATGGGGHAGALVAAGAQRIGRRFSLGASAIFATHSYRDIAAVNGGVLTKQFSGFASLSLRHFGSAGVAFAGVDQDAGQNLTPLNLYAAQHSRVLSVNYSRAIHHMAIYASEFKDFGSSTGSAGFQVGLTIPLGRRNMVDISGTSDGNAQVYAQQPAVLVGEWGYQALVAAGNSTHIFAQGTYKSPVGLISAGIDQNAGQLTGRVETQGALSFVDRALFASNFIYDSFAIVDTGSVDHVHVLQENRDVGLTNSSGRLLVADLRSFDLNHIAIEATDIPADATIDDPSRVVRPQDRSGVVVKFPVVISHGALVRLTDEAGAPIPLGSVARLKGVETADPVGYEGEAFIESLTPHNELTVTLPDGRTCTVAFDYQPSPGEIPSMDRCAVSGECHDQAVQTVGPGAAYLLRQICRSTDASALHRGLHQRCLRHLHRVSDPGDGEYSHQLQRQPRIRDRPQFGDGPGRYGGQSEHERRWIQSAQLRALQRCGVFSELGQYARHRLGDWYYKRNRSDFHRLCRASGEPVPSRGRVHRYHRRYDKPDRRKQLRYHSPKIHSHCLRWIGLFAFCDGPGFRQLFGLADRRHIHN